MKQHQLATTILEQLSASCYHCSLRGSLAKGCADMLSDIDIEVKSEKWNKKKIEDVLSIVSKTAGNPCEVRFDNEIKESIFISIHSYVQPIVYRVDIILCGDHDNMLREYLNEKYPWYTHWHKIMKSVYAEKMKKRGEKAPN